MMNEIKSNFRRGSVELLILHLLNQKDFYGYELSQTIKKQSNNVISIPVGSLYPALYKLIDNQCISDYKVQTNKRLVHIYYHIEPKGIERYKQLIEDYWLTNKGIQSVLNTHTGENNVEKK